MPDKDRKWKKIEAEYLSGHTSYQKLSEKYGIPLNTLKRYGKKHDWYQNRAEIEAESGAKIRSALSPKIVEAKVKEAVEYESMFADMIRKVREGIELCDPADVRALRLMVSALKDLQEMQGLNKSELDKAEQQARIDALRAKSREQKAEPLTIVIEGGEDFA